MTTLQVGVKQSDTKPYLLPDVLLVRITHISHSSKEISLSKLIIQIMKLLQFYEKFFSEIWNSKVSESQFNKQ